MRCIYTYKCIRVYHICEIGGICAEGFFGDATHVVDRVEYNACQSKSIHSKNIMKTNFPSRTHPLFDCKDLLYFFGSYALYLLIPALALSLSLSLCLALHLIFHLFFLNYKYLNLRHRHYSRLWVFRWNSVVFSYHLCDLSAVASVSHLKKKITFDFRSTRNSAFF